MDLFYSELFLGIPLTTELSQKLNKVEPQILAHFLNNQQNEFLQTVNCADIVYLGKKVSQVVEVEQLYLVKTHIYSIIKKLIPSYQINEDAFSLITVSEKNAIITKS